MTSSRPRDVLIDIEQLRRQAAADRRASSVPLLVFGPLTLLGVPLIGGGLSMWALFYWAIAGPVGFFVIGAWYRRRRIIVGIGSGRGSYAGAGVTLLVAFALVLPLWAIPLPTIGGVLFVLAARQRNIYLGIFAILFGVMGGLEEFSVFDNLLYKLSLSIGWFKPDYGYFRGAPTIVYITIAVMMVFAGLVARRRELRFVSCE